VRARVHDGAVHFMFDMAVMGLYLERFGHWTPAQIERSRTVMPWLTLLVGWPMLVFLIPQQHPLLQLVGLRAAIFFLPFIAIGARTEPRDLDDISRWLAWLNLAAFGFAIAEFFMGIESFFPRNAVTQIMYASTDVGGAHAHRIPSTFSSATRLRGHHGRDAPLPARRAGSARPRRPRRPSSRPRSSPRRSASSWPVRGSPS